MNLGVEHDGDVVVVALPGENLDVSNVNEFKVAVVPALEGARRVVFDLSAVAFVDSSGLGAILSSMRQLGQRRGELRLCGISPQVMSLFELVRMERIFQIFPDRTKAVRSFDE